MTQTYTGNPEIDKYLVQNIKPDSKTSGDYFLDYVSYTGSKEDIDYVFTKYFDLDELINHYN